MTAGEVDDVVLVGGSTLLPGFFSWFEERFERRRVRAWQPFEAVAFGANQEKCQGLHQRLNSLKAPAGARGSHAITQAHGEYRFQPCSR